MGVQLQKINGYIKPTHAMVKKAKASLGIPSTIKLPRCPAKNAKMRGEDDGRHDGADHICDECRCNYRAGWGTSHLGVGFCLVHENSAKYKGSAGRVMESHKIAIRQGYPDKAYTYAQADPKGYIEKIRSVAEDAGGMTDLREDIVALRAEVQKALNKDTFKVRVKKVEKQYENGKIVSSSDVYVLMDADDKERAGMLASLTRAIGRLSVDNLKLTDDDVVSYDQVKIWASGIVSIVERSAPDQKWLNDFVIEFAKLMNNVKTGRG